jgi:hypothetical protein
MAQSFPIAQQQGSAPRPALRFDWLRASIASGFIATFAMTVCMTLAYAIAKGAGDANGNAFERQLEALSANELTRGVGDTFAVGMVLNLAMGLLWAMIYARWAEPRLTGPGWRRGAIFSLVPFALSILVFFPIAGIGILGIDADAGILPVLGNLILHLVFGVVLGSLYAIDAWSGIGTQRDAEANSNSERAAALGVMIGGIAGVIGGFALGPTLDDLASSPVIALAGALTGAAIGMLIGSFLGLHLDEPSK